MSLWHWKEQILNHLTFQQNADIFTKFNKSAPYVLKISHWTIHNLLKYLAKYLRLRRISCLESTFCKSDHSYNKLFGHRCIASSFNNKTVKSKVGECINFLEGGGWEWNSTVRAPVFGRHQFFGTSEHYGKAYGSLLTGWMNYDYIASCWFPKSSNSLIHPSQFWQIRFESYWSHCSKCRILVLLR